jgi:hypothetical protein
MFTAAIQQSLVNGDGADNRAINHVNAVRRGARRQHVAMTACAAAVVACNIVKTKENSSFSRFNSYS